MKGDQIADAHHFTRLCKAKHINDDGTGQLGAAAFYFREIDRDGLSCNWLERFVGSHEEQIRRIKALCRLKVTNSSRWGTVNSGQVRQRIRENANSLEISIVEDPLEPEERFAADPSHALVARPADEFLMQVAVDLAVSAIVEPHS